MCLARAVFLAGRFRSRCVLCRAFGGVLDYRSIGADGGTMGAVIEELH